MTGELAVNVKTTKKGNHYVVMPLEDFSRDYCGASVGFACTTKDGKPMSTFHKARKVFDGKVVVPVKLHSGGG